MGGVGGALAADRVGYSYLCYYDIYRSNRIIEGGIGYRKAISLRGGTIKFPVVLGEIA